MAQVRVSKEIKSDKRAAILQITQDSNTKCSWGKWPNYIWWKQWKHQLWQKGSWGKWKFGKSTKFWIDLFHLNHGIRRIFIKSYIYLWSQLTDLLQPLQQEHTLSAQAFQKGYKWKATNYIIHIESTQLSILQGNSVAAQIYSYVAYDLTTVQVWF